MLTALEEGVKGGKWFSLIDKVYAPRNLRAAFQRGEGQRRGGGSGPRDGRAVRARPEKNLEAPDGAIAGGQLPTAGDPAGVDSQAGEQGEAAAGDPDGARPGGAGGVAHVLEPIFERDFAEHSYGFRPGRGCKDALRRVDELLQAGLHLGGGCRPEELLRHDPARAAAGAGGARKCRTAESWT